MGFSKKDLGDVVWSSETGRDPVFLSSDPHAALTRANPGTHSNSSPTSATDKVSTYNASVPNLHPMIRTKMVSGLKYADRQNGRPTIEKRRIAPPLSEGPQALVSSWSGALPSHDLSPQPKHRLKEKGEAIPRYSDNQR